MSIKASDADYNQRNKQLICLFEIIVHIQLTKQFFWIKVHKTRIITTNEYIYIHACKEKVIFMTITIMTLPTHSIFEFYQCSSNYHSAVLPNNQNVKILITRQRFLLKKKRESYDIELETVLRSIILKWYYIVMKLLPDDSD